MGRGLKDFLIGIVVSVAVFVAIEAFARIASTVRFGANDDTVWGFEAGTAYSPRLGWVNKPYEGRWEGSGHRSYGEQGLLTVDAVQLDLLGQKKILFVGGSNTFGYGVETKETFAEVVDDLLPDAATINMGVPGYSCYQTRLLVEEQLPTLRPDVVVVDCGFNDRREARPGYPDGPETFKTLYESTNSFPAKFASSLQSIYTYRELTRVFRATGLVPRGTEFTSLSAAEPRVGEDAFRENLVAIIEAARTADASVVFVLTGDNPHELLHIAEGIRRFESGEYQGAVSVLKTAIVEDKYYEAMARLYLAKSYSALGEEGSALEALMHVAPREPEGGTPIRLASQYNAITRDVAARYDAVILDAWSVIGDRLHLTTGFGHMSAEGHAVVAQELARAIQPLLAERETPPN